MPAAFQVFVHCEPMAFASDGGRPKVPSQQGCYGKPSVNLRSWRALLDSNQWPSTSELAHPVSRTLTGTPQPSSNRTVTAEPGSQPSTSLPPGHEDFVTRLSRALKR